ncbi:MAG: hypothetical protein ABJA64_00580 [Candidatus Saccharibacteria bacterium]
MTGEFVFNPDTHAQYEKESKVRRILGKLAIKRHTPENPLPIVIQVNGHDVTYGTGGLTRHERSMKRNVLDTFSKKGFDGFIQVPSPEATPIVIPKR